MAKRVPLPLEHSVDFRGVKMGYRVFGEGRPVILLHGSFIARPWSGFEERLAQKGLKVFVPDLPGFGSSEVVPGVLHTSDLFAEALAHFVRSLALESVPVIAFSFGALVALKSAASHGLVSKLLLIGLPGKVEPGPQNLLFRVPPLTRRKIFASNFVKAVLMVPAIVKNTGIEPGFKLKDLKQGLFKKVICTDPCAQVDPDYRQDFGPDLRRLFPLVKNEKVFFYGEKDPARGSTDDFLEKKYVLIPGSGHTPFRFFADETIALLLPYLLR